MKTLLFVDDEPMLLNGIQRQLHGTPNDWQLVFAQSGPQALRLLATMPVDVIISDMVMPGMDGAELLGEVMQRYPRIVRLVLSGHADQEAVLRLAGPAHQYLSKPCNPDELRAAIARAVTMREALSNHALGELVSRIPSLPSLPSLHTEITAELAKEDPSIERVAEIVSRDLAMTSKILQLVNSGFFGVAQRVSTISDAVLYLGLATIRALIFSFQVFSQFDSLVTREFSIGALSNHCWRTAVFARRIARLMHGNAKVDEQCFLAGMLHDLGHLILADGLPEQYAELLGQARADERNIVELEFETFGTTHAEAGAHLLGLWGLPVPIIEAVALHHRPAARPDTDFSPVLAVHLADAFASEKTGAHPEPPGDRVDPAILSAPGLAATIESWRDQCLSQPV